MRDVDTERGVITREVGLEQSGEDSQRRASRGGGGRGGGEGVGAKNARDSRKVTYVEGRGRGGSLGSPIALSGLARREERRRGEEKREAKS
jgi:hypothetical protein